ncbi:MAG: PHP domain-containing protein [Eubacteriales bacterium]|nr:PHP domain-containing protein [Eubacteriales bacterium]
MQKIEITSDFHTHTRYSHGKGSVLDNAMQAQKLGFDCIAITDHGVNHPLVGVSRSRFDEIRADIANVQSSIDDCKILFGIEGNVIGEDGEIDLTDEDVARLDIVLAGFHLTAKPAKFRYYGSLVFNGLTHYIASASSRQIAANTRAYVNAVKKHPIDVLTHLGFRLDVDYKEVAKACADYGTFIELSSRHKTPSDKVIEDILSTGATLIVNSDAHKVENIGKWEYAMSLIDKFDIPEARIANCNHKIPQFRSRYQR